MSGAKQADPAPEALQRGYDAEELLKLPSGRLRIDFEPQELAALSDANGLEGVRRLSADLSVLREGKGLHISGTLSGEVTYLCGVTLEPFDAPLTGGFDASFVPSAPPPRQRGKGREGNPPEREAASRRRAARVEEVEDISPEDADPPEPIRNGRVELGGLLAEFFSLALDPFPRRPDAAFEAQPGAGAKADGEASTSPFAKLAGLKRDS